jgi:hypothetical protein
MMKAGQGSVPEYAWRVAGADNSGIELVAGLYTFSNVTSTQLASSLEFFMQTNCSLCLSHPANTRQNDYIPSSLFEP